MRPAGISNYFAYYGEVPELVSSELERSGEGTTVIHAGHYMLHIAQDDRPSDYLERGSEPRPGFEAFDYFTRTTWAIGCEAIRQAHGSTDPKLMVLANDWQYLAWRNLPRRESERKAACARTAYYHELTGLPDYHESQLEVHNLGPAAIFRASDGRAVFSESMLRQQLASTIKTLLKNTVDPEHLGLRCQVDEHGELLVGVETTECTSMPLLQSGNTNCAGEVVELINQLHQRGIRNFINLYPAQCQVPVEAGTDLANHLFGLSDMAITNVAIPCSGLR